MGRSLKASEIEAASILYPCMQVADIFQMGLDVACAGMDQRKAHMLARDVAEKLGQSKPACVHTPLLAGLQEPASGGRELFDENKDLDKKISVKMSKSIASSSILIHDNEDEVRAKIKAAYCPPKVGRGNPVLEIAKYIIFPEKAELHIQRDKRHGGPIHYSTYLALESDYCRGIIHPLDLKIGISMALSEILARPRAYFDEHSENFEAMKRIVIES
jgi:tyrosyl-tRNA synthetase